MDTDTAASADDVRCAQSAGLPESTALTLTQHPHRGVRVNLAANPSITAAVQYVLARDHWLVRSYLAHNPALLPEIQLMLAAQDSVAVRISLAGNPSLELRETLPYAFLESFERGRDFITGTVASAGVDPEVLEALRQDWSGTLEDLVTTALEFAR